MLAIESFVTETDSSVLEVLRGWKSRAQTGDKYLKNYLHEQLGRPLLHTEHAREMFDEATSRTFPLLFTEAPPAEQAVLALGLTSVDSDAAAVDGRDREVVFVHHL